MADALTRLNADSARGRLANLEALLQTSELTPLGTDVNNHIHTTYSFSPYSPTAAAWMARREGLCTAGIVDHDSIAGAREFLRAAAMLGLGGACGIETRVSLAGTPFADRRVNNPDQAGVAYMLLHGVPHGRIEEVDAFFAPLRDARNDRNRRMVERLNGLLAGSGIALDFDRDIVPLSEAQHGGSITERHISSALANELEKKAGRGDALVSFLERTFGKPVGEKYRAMFSDAENPYFHYDLIGWIKAELIPLFYIDATDECAPIRDVLALGERTGAITVYPYLGDIGGESVTGDKRAQKFEDDFLDELFDTLEALGFRGIAYMPTRNTPAQLKRLRALIAKKGFIEISGEDINQPRQSFVCEAMHAPGFDALYESSWALIAHEREADGLFSEAAIRRQLDLQARIADFARRGKDYAGV